MIIEWNHHLFSADQTRFPLHPNAPYTPEFPAGDPLLDYRAHMDRVGIDRAVLVQPAPYRDDHRLLLDALKREPKRCKGVCLFDADDGEAPAKLADLVARQPLFVAQRFHLLNGRDLGPDSVLPPGIQRLWTKAVDLGLAIELHMDATYAGPVANMLQRYPRTTVVIDHLAEAGFRNSATPVEFARVLDLAAFAGVYMKLSGLNHFARDAPHYVSARPFTRRVIAEFGPDRLIWGSGVPEIVDAHMPEYSEEARMKVKGGNLQRLLGFD